MNTCSGVRSSRPARVFSFGLLDGLRVRLRRPHVRAASAGFRLERLATAFMNNPGRCWMPIAEENVMVCVTCQRVMRFHAACWWLSRQVEFLQWRLHLESAMASRNFSPLFCR